MIFFKASISKQHRVIEFSFPKILYNATLVPRRKDGEAHMKITLIFWLEVEFWLCTFK